MVEVFSTFFSSFEFWAGVLASFLLQEKYATKGTEIADIQLSQVI